MRVHSDRGSQYVSEKHGQLHEAHGVVGSMSRRRNAYDDPQAESFTKMLKVEDAYLIAHETLENVAAGVPRFIDAYDQRRRYTDPGYLGPIHFEDRNARTPFKTAA